MEGSIIQGQSGRWRSLMLNGQITFICGLTSGGCKKSGGTIEWAASYGSWPNDTHTQMKW